jgi:hypothetical protein
MFSKRNSVSEVESFITLLCVACEDDATYRKLEKILSLADSHRKEVLAALLREMRERQAPQELMKALDCLRDDAVAERAYEAIFKCQRGMLG